MGQQTHLIPKEVSEMLGVFFLLSIPTSIVMFALCFPLGVLVIEPSPLLRLCRVLGIVCLIL